ncbi:hypothetical protein SLS56_008280 [Neofusicoccum ribis]|uniref:Zn(2)-C6 fungal-type domain-containing protein n=1 Tax=Neofusicoccum ribis TaxID=45134 RepID=A0ABR3SKG9_9PEZI
MGDRGQPIGGPPIHPPKRKRLSRACNWCRKQKVRCDESLPSCLNCRLRNLHCLTTEPKTGAEIASTDRKHSAKHRPSPPECRSDPGSPYSSTTASTATSMLALAAPGSRRTDSSSTTSTALPATSSARSRPPWTSLPTPETTFALPPASSRAGPPPSPPKPRTEPAAAAQEEPRGNAVLTPQSSDYAINYGDEPVRRKFLGASSSQVLVQWLDLSFSRRGPWPNVSQFFRYGISTAEEFTYDLWPSPKPLPPYPECAKYLSVYHSRIHPLFPVLDVPELTGIFKDLADKDPRSLSQSDLPSLACCYAVTSIGMDAISGKPSDLAIEYLTGAYSLIITLHRTALILDTNVFREQVKRHVPDIQSSYRLNHAEDICIASARAIVRVLNELKSSCGDLAHLLTASVPLLSTFVLTISILKHPARWNVKTDLAATTTGDYLK